MLKSIINIDKNPIIINFSKSVLGKILSIAIFYFYIKFIPLYPNDWQETLLICVVVISFFPKYRYLCLFSGMISLMLKGLLIGGQEDWFTFRYYYLYLDFLDDSSVYMPSSYIRFMNIFLVLLCSELLIYLVRNFRQYKIFHYPITLLYLFIFSLITIVEYFSFSPWLRICVWSFIAIFCHYFWFIGYTLLEGKLNRQRNYLLDYSRYLPIWGFTALPYGKGSIYLSHVESKNEEDSSITRLKAIKLGCWAVILYLVEGYFHRFGEFFHVSDFSTALAQYAQGQHYSVYMAWACVINKYLNDMFGLTVTGHLVVSSCRMCGFRILRNTYRPFESYTIAEYWSRYNYYFKELLSEFFFYPAYFRYFKTWPRLRILFATLSAATFGNILFHLFLMTPVMISAGVVKALNGYVSYVFYTIVLGISIGFSHMRHMTLKTKPNNFHRYIFSPFFVIIFYSIMSIFNQVYQQENIQVNFKLFFSLFNINW